MTDTDRLPPHNRESERALLSSMLRETHIAAEMGMHVKAEDFYAYGHQLIFAAATSLADAGKPVDLATVAEMLIQRKQLDDCGGAAMLAELLDAAPSVANYQQYAETVRGYAIRRNLISACNEIASEAYDLGTPALEIVGQAEQRLSDIAETGITSEAVDLETALRESIVNIESRKNKDTKKGVPTGFVDLDSVTCGLQDSELTVIGARPSVGKTALAINIARNAAVEFGRSVMFISLEQARTELAERMLSLDSRVNSHQMRTGHLSTDELSKLLDSNDRMHKAKLLIDDRPQQTMTYIGASARRARRKQKIELLIIDYMQLIDVEDRRQPRQEQVASISRRMKLLARDLKIPVLCVAQLNRGAGDGGDRPKLSDLRESGAIEQDADAVLLLHRDGDISDVVWKMTVSVAKNRNGQTGDVDLMFDRRCTRFDNYAKPMEGDKW